jgi:hypothetical protein
MCPKLETYLQRVLWLFPSLETESSLCMWFNIWNKIQLSENNLIKLGALHKEIAHQEEPNNEEDDW